MDLAITSKFGSVVHILQRISDYKLFRPFIYLLVFPFGSGEVPRLRWSTGERFGERKIIFELLFSFSGDGDEPPPVAEFRRDGVRRMVVSKCLNLLVKKN